MQYELIRIDPDAVNDEYPIGTRESVDEQLLKAQVHRNVFMGKLEDVICGLFFDLPHALGSPAARRWLVGEAARRRQRPSNEKVEYSDLGYILAGAMIQA